VERSGVAKPKPNLSDKKPFGGTPNGFAFQAAYKPNGKGWGKRCVNEAGPAAAHG